MEIHVASEVHIICPRCSIAQGMSSYKPSEKSGVTELQCPRCGHKFAYRIGMEIPQAS
jgi:uncharacterized C2H2 Zn-finger protein